MKTCIMCEKRIKEGRLYCYNHYQQYLAVKGQQCYSVDDDPQAVERPDGGRSESQQHYLGK